jgi:hypothetical protein
MTKVEYRVRPVTRYIITRYAVEGAGGSIETRGEYDNAHVAYEVGYALAKAEHERLGYPPGDERIVYPEPLAVAPNGFPDTEGVPLMPGKGVARSLTPRAD